MVLVGAAEESHPTIDRVYRTLYLERAPLSAEETADIIGANKPAFTSRPFPVVLAAIGLTLTNEAFDLAMERLTSMVGDYREATKSEPR